MPIGYKLNPNEQMKIEDERAGRLDYAYETSLTVGECQKRVGNAVSGKLSQYETEVKDGVLYISFIESTEDTGGLFVPIPQKYAVRFETMADKTIIRARYMWDEDTMNVQYNLREDVDAFFTSLFDATVAEEDKKVWTDSGEEFANNDPLKIHGSKAFWPIAGVFVLLWLAMMIFMNIAR